MEVFGIIGMSMGSMGFIFALSAINQAASCKKELEELKTELRNLGMLPDSPKEED